MSFITNSKERLFSCYRGNYLTSEGEEGKAFYYYSFYRNDILHGIFTTVIDFVTWPPLQIMHKGGHVTQVIRSCENAL